MRINTNMGALNAWRNMTVNNGNLQKSLEKLSSGYRINRAADDAAGLAVSEKMRAQIRGTNQAIRNAQDGVSLVQTAEGAAAKIGDMLQRMRELAVQASSDTLQTEDRTLLAKEFDELQSEITRLAGNADSDGVQFNGQNLLNGDFSEKLIQVGANSGETIEITFDALDAETLGIDQLDISEDGADFEDILDTLDEALNTVNEQRAYMGAIQNRLETAIETLQVQSENLTAAESRIRDVDMASEMANFTKNNILLQASQAMLAQANQSTQGVLSLLR